MPRTMAIDIETYSSVDLAKSGVYAYTEAPDFDILLIGYKFDDDEVRVIDTMDTDYKSDPELKKVFSALTDPSVIKTAYNANFERTCLAKWFKTPMPAEEWRCTMVKALTLGLPASLENVSAALGLLEDKQKDRQGKALISYFCKPCKPTRSNGQRTRNFPWNAPDKWWLFKEYCRQDVIAEQAVSEILSEYETTEAEQELWILDQNINDTGVRIDINMVDKIVRYDAERSAELQEEAKVITGLNNPNSLSQLKKWLAEQGVPMPSITKNTIAEVLRTDIPKSVRRALEIRLAQGKTSTAKYSAMLAAACDDGRLRGSLQFYGANRTGRWAGRLVQTHNLARNTLPDLDLARELAMAGDFETLETLFGETAFVFSELVRTAFIPSEGSRFIVSDFSAIEARVVAWLAGEDWVLNAFREGKDIYCETASMMYRVPVVKGGENGHLRQRGKTAVLACGYQGGVGAMKRMDREGIIPEEELQEVVNMWRSANPRIVKFWKRCELAAKTAIEERRTVRLTRGIAFRYKNNNLFVKLPDGRELCYWQARLKQDINTGRQSIVYMGVNQETRRWSETETYGGKLVENMVQATARDCLAIAMQRMSAEGYKIVMHIHDEIVVDAPCSDTDAPAVINEIMGLPIDWAPGLPLEGETFETSFYKKD